MKVVDKIKVPFVLAASKDGPMIVSRLDFTPYRGNGVGAEILTTGEYDGRHIELLLRLLSERRAKVVIDGGANIGAYTLPMASLIEPWGGTVLAWEPQERVYYALCGNIALNNLFNVRALQGALAADGASVFVPALDFQAPGNYGMLTLNPSLDIPAADFGQEINRSSGTIVPITVIDHLNLPRLDLLKLDIEGMEIEALTGARNTIARCKPMIFAEIMIVSPERYRAALGADWNEVWVSGMMALYLHKDDPLNGAEWLKQSAREVAWQRDELLRQIAEKQARVA